MTYADCERCGRYQLIRARGLCSHCYESEAREGTIQRFPTIPERSRNPPTVCHCASPLVDRLILWDAYQCGSCGRPITPERIDELTNESPD